MKHGVLDGEVLLAHVLSISLYALSNISDCYFNLDSRFDAN